MAKVGSFKIVEQFFSKANIHKLIVCLGRYDLGHRHVAQSPSPQRRVMQISADLSPSSSPRSEEGSEEISVVFFLANAGKNTV